MLIRFYMQCIYTLHLLGFPIRSGYADAQAERYIPVFAFFPFYLTPPLPPRVLVLYVGVCEGLSGFVGASG